VALDSVAGESTGRSGITSTFEYLNGDPVALNGKRLSPASMLAELNRIAASTASDAWTWWKPLRRHEVAWLLMKPPGGTIMLRAHRAIESLTLDREVAHLKDDLMPRYAA